MEETIEDKLQKLEEKKNLLASLKARDNALGQELAELENESLVQ